MLALRSIRPAAPAARYPEPPVTGSAPPPGGVLITRHFVMCPDGQVDGPFRFRGEAEGIATLMARAYKAPAEFYRVETVQYEHSPVCDPEWDKMYACPSHRRKVWKGKEPTCPG